MSSDVKVEAGVAHHRHKTLEERLREAQAIIEFEEDPHRAALEDNPAEVKVDARTWAAVMVRRWPSAWVQVSKFWAPG